MNNAYLEELFKKYKVSEKNRREILQIFTLLPDDKKQNLLNNFAVLASRLAKIEKSIEIEKKLLLGEAVKRVEDAILKNREESSV